MIRNHIKYYVMKFFVVVVVAVVDVAVMATARAEKDCNGIRLKGQRNVFSALYEPSDDVVAFSSDPPIGELFVPALRACSLPLRNSFKQV